MIDLIIPYYNNYQGLLQTLSSINLDVFKITVVDDYSTEPITTTFPINYIRLDENKGPGRARQVGLNNTYNNYVAFIDTGDIFLSKELQKEMEDTVLNNPKLNMFMWTYQNIFNIQTNVQDNRMHGKIYKRSFLNKYNITFCRESSYANEDIGFNRACRICTQADNKEIQFINTSVIKQIPYENSITKKNNNEFTYKDQTKGLALNTIHVVNICKYNNIDPTEEIYSIAGALYYWFIVTAAERPEFIQEAWSGAKIFYDAFQNEIKPNKLVSGNAYIKKCLTYRNKIPFTVNILRFIDDIKNSEIIPDNYLTLN